MAMAARTTSFLASDFHTFALGVGGVSTTNTALTVTYVQPTPTTSNDGSVASATSIAGAGTTSPMTSSGGSSSQTVYLIIFMSILALLLLVSTAVTIRSMVLRQRYRNRIASMIASGELPPNTGPNDYDAIGGLPRWMAWMNTMNSIDGEDIRGMRGMRDRRWREGYRDARLGGRKKDKKKLGPIPILWEVGTGDTKEELRMVESGSMASGPVDEKGQLDIAQLQPISLLLKNTSPIAPAEPPPDYPPVRHIPTSPPPSMFTLQPTFQPLAQSLSRTLSRYTSNNSDAASVGGVDANGNLSESDLTTALRNERSRRRNANSRTGDQETSGSGSRHLGWLGLGSNRRSAGLPEIVHEAHDESSRAPSRNVSRRPSLSGVPTTGGGSRNVSRRPSLSGHDQLGTEMGMRHEPNSVLPASLRNPLGSAETAANPGTSRQQPSSALPASTPSVAAGPPSISNPSENQLITMNFLIRMPERQDVATERIRRGEEDEDEAMHAPMEIAVWEGFIGSEGY